MYQYSNLKGSAPAAGLSFGGSIVFVALHERVISASKLAHTY